MKILFLDLNFQNIYKNRKLLAEMFRHIPTCHIFGPGYVTKDILAQGLKTYVKVHGPFEVVVATEHVTSAPFCQGNTTNHNWIRNYYFDFAPKFILPFINEAYDYFRNFSGIKIATYMETDYYHFSLERTEILEQLNAYILGWGIEFFEDIRDISDLSNDTFTKNANNHWRDFLLRNAKKIISFPYFVHDEEIYPAPIETRKYSWSIVGADYYKRQKVRSILSENHIKWVGNNIRRLFSLFGKLKLNPYNKLIFINFINYIFKKTLRMSRYSYTDGSSLQYLIRKYIEIPAAGAVLVCDECKGFSEFGFVAGVNAIICHPEEIVQVHGSLEENLETAQQIASCGQDLIFKQHRLQARLQQFQDSLKAIKNEIFNGSYWKNGQFIIATAQKTSHAIYE